MSGQSRQISGSTTPLERLRGAQALIQVRAASGAYGGGLGAAGAGAALGVLFAFRRGAIPDHGTTVAVGLLGTLLLALALGFLGTLAGAFLGALIGLAQAAVHFLAGRPGA